jgi:hypothetical protein
VYESCNVTKLDPPSRPVKEIPAGTQITVEIVCSPADQPEPEITEPQPQPGSASQPESAAPPAENQTNPADGTGE